MRRGGPSCSFWHGVRPRVDGSARARVCEPKRELGPYTPRAEPRGGRCNTQACTRGPFVRHCRACVHWRRARASQWCLLRLAAGAAVAAPLVLTRE